MPERTDEHLGNYVWRRANGTYYRKPGGSQESRELNSSQALFLASDDYEARLEMWKRVGGQKLLLYYLMRLVEVHEEFRIQYKYSVKKLEDATGYSFDSPLVLVLRNGDREVWLGDLSDFTEEGWQSELKGYVDETFPIE